MVEIGLRGLAQMVLEHAGAGEEFVNRSRWELELISAYYSPRADTFLPVGGQSVLFIDIPKGTPMRVRHEASSPPALDVRFPSRRACNQHFLYEPGLVRFAEARHPARLWLPTTYVSKMVPGHEQARLCYVFSGAT